MDPTDNRKNPSHSERVQARQRANTPWPKLDRSWVDHPFYICSTPKLSGLDYLYELWLDSDTRDTMPEGPGE